VADLLYAPLRGQAGVPDLAYRLDPRSKLLFVASLALYLAWMSRTEVLLLVLAGLHLWAVLSRGTRVRLPNLWRALLPLVVTILLLGSLRWRPEHPLLAVGPVALTWASLWSALGLATRVLALSLGLSMMLWTTEPGDLVAGLTRLHVPFALGLGFVMALQYVMTFQLRFRQILEAQQSRGLRLARANPIRAARTYVPVIVPLMISALRSVDSLALALQSRGLGGRAIGARGSRTSRRVLRLHARDWVFVFGAWAALLGLSVLRWNTV
jgi:energy-coupling factor transport system permease protein